MAKRPKLTDAERHKRFIDTAREVDASEQEQDFERAFEKVTRAPKSPVAKPPD
jgi:hypothetical protein